MKTEDNPRPTPTPEQEKAIEHLGSPLLVLAGPGTGKTTVLALRILFLLEKRIATKNQILAVTFTTKAAGEMRDRLIEYGLPENKHPWIATLHAVAARILHEHTDAVGLPNDFVVADSGESRLALDDASNRTARHLSLDAGSLRRLMPELKQVRYNGWTSSQVTHEPLRSLCGQYEQLLRFYQASDFDGLLIHALTILHKKSAALAKYQAKARLLLIDEYQDINEAQHQLVKLLAGNPNGVFAVGDDDQSIYSWRGGSPHLILAFDKSFPDASEITLSISQRCPGHILRGARHVIEHNKNRVEKDLKPLGPDGELIRILSSKSENAEAQWIAQWIKGRVNASEYSPSDITVLSTDPTIAELSYQEVLKQGIKALRRTETPLNSVPVHMVVSLIRAVVDPYDNLAVRRSLEEGPVKGVGQKAIDKILSAAERKNCSMWEVLLKPGENGLSRWGKTIRNFVRYIGKLQKTQRTTKVTVIIKNLAASVRVEADERTEWLIKEAKDSGASDLEEFLEHLRSKVALDVTGEASDGGAEDAVCFLTTYLVKGLEAKVVFVIGLEEGLFPDPTKDIEEQRRLFYVAMTRAKAELFLCTSKMRKVRGFQFYRASPFIAEIPKEYRKYIDNTR